MGLRGVGCGIRMGLRVIHDEVYERMRVVSSRVVTGRDGDSAGCCGGDDWRTNFEVGCMVYFGRLL